MNRSGYSDACDGRELILWRGAVASAIRGKRGQAVLREILAALDALPKRTLVAESLKSEDGGYCTLGALGRARGMAMDQIDPEDRAEVAKAFGIAEALAAEIMFENDECSNDWRWVQHEVCGPMRPFESHDVRYVRLEKQNEGEIRWHRMREWVASKIKG